LFLTLQVSGAAQFSGSASSSSSPDLIHRLLTQVLMVIRIREIGKDR
jgi:hypothetical protein